MKTTIFQRIERATTFDFGDVLSKSFELFKKIWVEGLIHILLSIAVVLPILLIVYAPLIPLLLNAQETTYASEFNPFVAFPVVWMIGYFILVFALILVLQVFVTSITVHFFRLCKKEDMGIQEPIGGYFSFIKEATFMKIFMLQLAVVGISIAAMLLCYLPLFYVIVPLNLAIVILAFNPKLTVSELLKASFKLGNKFWLLLFAMMLVSGLIAELGIIACGIGILATVSYVHIAMYYVYKDTVGFEETDFEMNNETLKL
ncbi:hypothetical protein [Cochleicola gelatinilyticus]|uniref:Glycerophosphoryl diester phosphodiesterase membrane domain-containing protein n=1 Tax=Cochleicola gelatinilyticus TaxID=1763537 RepID=A0A167IL73_9FLAO|nr:hypothetical protein [Cochleicola gelatinilyticus]OAB79780.1 hypothetical protein ULVI_03275 [Cochleicola gelatinilyticus]